MKRKLRRLSKGLWEVDTFMLVQYQPATPSNGHHRTVAVWKDMRGKMVGYNLSDCLAIAAVRRECGHWPFPALRHKERAEVRAALQQRGYTHIRIGRKRPYPILARPRGETASRFFSSPRQAIKLLATE